MRYCGRYFSEDEIQWIKKAVSTLQGINRCQLSKLFCERYIWRKQDGGLKDMSCRVAMLKMERDGVITLPAVQRKHHRPKRRMEWSLLTSPGNEVTESAGNLSFEFKIVKKSDSSLWNEFIDRYHYLGYTPLPGAQLQREKRRKEKKKGHGRKGANQYTGSTGCRKTWEFRSLQRRNGKLWKMPQI